MKRKGFDPNLHSGMTAKSDAEYVELRLSQTHDLWHIITGFDTSVVGEIGLQAFHLPQFPYPLATMLVGISLISATLEDPEMLPKLLEAIAQGFQMGKTAKPLFAQKWEEGWENIYGIVIKRRGTKILRRINSALFYWLASKLTDGRIPRNASDFRLVDRKVYKAVREMQERNRFVRGLYAWAGFKSIGIPMERPPRFGGISNAHTSIVLDLAFKGVFAHSYKPLRLITIFGFSLSLFSICLIPVLALIWVFQGVPFAGFGTMVALILLLFGLTAAMLGVVSEYIGLIYEEVKQRPNFIVTRTLNIKEGNELES
jgi:hypothetical protein